MRGKIARIRTSFTRSDLRTWSPARADVLRAHILQCLMPRLITRMHLRPEMPFPPLTGPLHFK